LAISDTTIGLSFNYQGTTDGVNYTSANYLTSLISHGTPPSVGEQIFPGYYRNAAGENNGNFTSTLRSLASGGPDQSLALRVYGEAAQPSAVPEPGSLFGVTCFLGSGALIRSRRDRPRR
jgi:hypothetical protein